MSRDLNMPASLPANAASNDLSGTTGVRAEQIKELYNQFQSGILAATATIVTTVIILWNQAGHALLLAWSGLGLAVAAYSGILSYLYRNTPVRRIDPSHWEKHALAVAALSGAFWASLAYLASQMGSLMHIAFAVFVIVVMAIYAIATLGALLPAYRIHAVLVLTPLILYTFTRKEDIAGILGLMLTAYLLVLLRTARLINRKFIASLHNGQQNAELVRALSESKEKAEQLNRDMHNEMLERKQAEDALTREKEQIQITLESIGDGVITTDNSGIIKYMNPFSEKFTGWSLEDARGRHLDKVFELIDENSREPITDIFNRCMHGNGSEGLPPDILLVPRSSKVEFAIDIIPEYSVEITATPIRNRGKQVTGAVLIFHDVTEIKGMARQMSYHASHDSLTGLINRREFDNRIEAALISAGGEGIHHILIYLDLDQFKIVNDTCGHLAGDELLKQISMLLQKKIRSVDTLARLGGDEFGLLLHGCDVKNAQIIADDMRQSIKDFRFSWQDRSFDIGTSVGLVPITADSLGKTELLSAADAACYVAKDQGRNRIHVYLPDDESITQRRGEIQWLHRIKDALSSEKLCLYYQPVQPLDGSGRSKIYCEFLLRMLDDKGDVIPPMAFIPAAERYQIMGAIDRWVVETVFGIVGGGHDIIDKYDICAINLSGQSLCDNEFLDFILIQLANHVVDPGKICFEITETAAIANFQQALHFITKLREMGCCFALDDFGSGLSSFAYLKSLDVDYLKIDGSFVKDMADDPIDHAMVQAINQIGHVMGKKTIAEFVENTSILPRLRKLGVDYAQGYGIERPRPLEIRTAVRRRG